MKIEKRKKDHLEISLKENVISDTSAGFEDITLIHQTLSELDLSDIDTSLKIFERMLDAPLIIESMTGGTAKAIKVNKMLALCAEQYGLGIGVGSQRAAIENPNLKKTYRVVRDFAPNALVFANIGCPQLSKNYGVEEAKMAIEMVEADALMIHSNPLQESVQFEGEPNFNGVLLKIQEICSNLKIPIVIKETGSGISAEMASLIQKTGVKGIDVAGLGGTSWSLVEYFRAIKAGRTIQQRLGNTFRNWGIPTCVSLVEATRKTNLIVISSGGLRTGLDIAKSIALGASAGGMALPILKAATQGYKFLNEMVETLIQELRLSMFLVGAKEVSMLRKVPLIIKGDTANWLNERGYSTEEYAKRTLR
ncbi:type 2 isopentenyl-diphosphate Delta-isomerase [Candidatus Bathyarchaeota archaeon RBG_13_38_9]|nr:MAG: type 2 isopentenyl-diphosphate Delta-isomerase [Candidatus Bathyarchaeota archaeon RBG_13_38_9]